MRKGYRIITILLGFASIAALLAACGNGTSSGSKLCNGQISIASDLPTTGTDGSEGKPAQNGVQLAVNQNTNVGNGYTLSLITYNDVSATLGKHDPDQGAKNVTDMVSNKCILGFVGPFNSNVAGAEIPVSEQSGLVMISPANTNPGLTIQAAAQPNGFDWNTLHPAGKPESYFRIPGNDIAQGTVDADIATSDLNAKTVYIVDDQEVYGVGIANYFSDEFKKKNGDASVLGRDGIPANGAAQIPGLAAKIAAAKPDVVYYGGVTSGGGGTLKAQLVAAGYNGPMVGGDGIGDDDGFIQQAGADASNNTYGTVGAPDTNSLNSGASTKFISDYKTAFPGQDLGAYSANSYDAAQILIAAIKSEISAGKDPSRAAMITAVQATDYNGVTGHITFDAHGDNASGGIWSLYKVDGGKWAFVKNVTSGS
ncbi:MAG TPA: branched-chain amino acid ABC transporter substrate-binding protein [Ktedonobacterales bacterium]|nr:branched-chain amino acid ABC transporter substrate-binding protein [Ktedonobacterales bacterium]